MPLDQDTQLVLDTLASLGAPDFADLSVEDARALSLTPPPAEPTQVGKVFDRTIAGLEMDVPVRIYQPPSQRTHSGALVYYHGGGWVIGNLDSHDEVCRQLCAGAGIVVVSVDYRLAPEARYPAAVTDCYDALIWTEANATELGINPRAHCHRRRQRRR